MLRQLPLSAFIHGYQPLAEPQPEANAANETETETEPSRVEEFTNKNSRETWQQEQLPMSFVSCAREKFESHWKRKQG
ncbi:GH11134 [Drosophila grimshawi]|uniref:GH11134 n=1 Tax=Drosophila grimshawi TaxID=7222 RepID=B4JD75_DROGR|nr:GH11134 [Drosophila grimshawi]